MLTTMLQLYAALRVSNFLFELKRVSIIEISPGGEAQASDADAAITELTEFIASGWAGMLTAEAPQSRPATRRTKHRSPHSDSALPRGSSRRRA